MGFVRPIALPRPGEQWASGDRQGLLLVQGAGSSLLSPPRALSCPEAWGAAGPASLWGQELLAREHVVAASQSGHTLPRV